MEFISSTHYEEILKITKFKPTKSKIPLSIVKVIYKNNLLSIEDRNERAVLFLKALYLKGLKSNTVIRYFNLLKPVLFENTTVVPNSLVFDDNYTRPVQYRGGNIGKIKQFINYVKYQVSATCPHKWPILISSYSGLRINEVCNIKMSHLSQLLNRDPIIPLKTKNNKDWEVVYYDEFEKLINIVILANKERYDLYVEKYIDSLLYPYTTQTLHVNVQHFYLLANNEHAPMGFGLHSIRYYLATIMYERTNKIEVSQTLLGHAQQRTTERYIKQDASRRKDELNALSDNVPLYRDIKKLGDRL